MMVMSTNFKSESLSRLELQFQLFGNDGVNDTTAKQLLPFIIILTWFLKYREV